MSQDAETKPAPFKPDAEYASKTWDVLASVGIAVKTGIPLPPSILKSLRNAADKLVRGATEYGMTYIDEAITKRKTIAAGRQLVLQSAAGVVAKKVTDDDKLLDRALDVFATDLIGKQQNKEKVLAVAVSELQGTKSFDVSEKVIDEDWLDAFSTVASQKSNADVQQLLGKILAGEIRQPGTFSPLTLHILSILTPEIARFFETFCNLSITWDPDQGPTRLAFLPHKPYPEYMYKGLPEYGIGYSEFLILQNYGLLAQKLDASFGLGAPILEAIVEIGGTRLKLKSKTGIPINLNLTDVSPLSMSGSELRTIISLNVPPAHLQKQIEYLDSLGFNVTT